MTLTPNEWGVRYLDGGAYVRRISLRDLGCKTVSVQCNVTASSPVVAADTTAHRLVAGDPVIVEPPQCRRGEWGDSVGVTWPAIGLADEAAILAIGDPGESPPPNANSVRYAQDTGDVYYWNDVTWLRAATSSPGQYYLHKVIPRSLVTTVSSVDGASITLADVAQNTLTGCTIYFDSARRTNLRLPHHVWGKYRDDDVQIWVPPGSWHASQAFTIRAPLTLRGAGLTSIVRNPLGVPSGVVHVLAGGDGATVDGLNVISNRIDAGGYDHGLSYYASIPSGRDAVRANNAANVTIQNCRVQDPFTSAVSFGTTSDCTAKFIDVVHTGPKLQYAGWDIGTSDSQDCLFEDCSWDSDTIAEAFEAFKSDRITLRRFTARNGLIATNGAQDWLYENLDMTFEAGSKPSDPNEVLAAVFNHNNNIGRAASEVYGGQIRNSTIEIEGAPDPSDDFSMIIAHSSALSDAVAGATYGPGLTLTVNGQPTDAIEHESTTAQALTINGVTTDGDVHIHNGTVDNLTAATLHYGSNTVTLGEGNDIDTLDDVDA